MTPTLTASEAADALGLAPGTFYRAAREGRINGEIPGSSPKRYDPLTLERAPRRRPTRSPAQDAALIKARMVRGRTPLPPGIVPIKLPANLLPHHARTWERLTSTQRGAAVAYALHNGPLVAAEKAPPTVTRLTTRLTISQAEAWAGMTSEQRGAAIAYALEHMPSLTGQPKRRQSEALER